LLPGACDTLDRLAGQFASIGLDAAGEIELSENIDATERVVHVDVRMPIDERSMARLSAVEGLTGLGPDASVTDRLAVGASVITLQRHVLAFFQGNRFLLRDVVAHVIDQVPSGSSLLDLYAGTGVFAVAAAQERRAQVAAVEGDRVAAADLQSNAAPCETMVVHHEAVEAFLAAVRRSPDVVIADPPRTGLSREALDGIVRLRAARIVYVSCDVATLARDARRLVDAGYTIARASAFDLFPNTPHVETIIVFDRPSA
jgi:tRNA/tmRNA/rRNA uracil-C5-methylase (TrmA/RlmC/RlmD family)